MGSTSPHHHNHLSLTKFISWAIYVLIPFAILHLYLFPFLINQNQISQSTENLSIPSSTTSSSQDDLTLLISVPKKKNLSANCDYADGQWVRSRRAPIYNGTSCGTIKDGQNCMAHGRPDTGYLHWRWQPKSCNLHSFDPVAFLRLVRNKHLAFIGDSMARNQLESLLCLLSSASSPELVYRDGEDNKFRRWVFPHFNATVSVFWSPFLVKGLEKSASSGLSHNKLYLDYADERWSKELDSMDIVIMSIGHWFLHPAIYHEGGNVLGCHHCPEFNHTEVGFFDVFRKAFKTALKEVSLSTMSKGDKFVVVTTFSPGHFEGEWDRAGACPKEEPYKEAEKEMEYMDGEMRKIELEEVAAAMTTTTENGRGGKVRFEALDVTKLAMLRPDGHPGPYMYPNPFADGVKERVQNDCVHWCLPGPIDTWNEILLEMLKRWKDGGIVEEL